MLSASAHKFNGPKGCGFLYVREGISIEPFMHGGAQEHGHRAGTENVAGIVGMAAALEEHQNSWRKEMTYLHKLADTLLGHLRETDLDFIVNGSAERIPGSLSLSFRNADGEMLLHRLDLMGTAVATGSACDQGRCTIACDSGNRRSGMSTSMGQSALRLEWIIAKRMFNPLRNR